MAPSGSSSSSTASTTSVQVALRIRPTNNHDLATIPSRFQKEVLQAVSSTSVSMESAIAAVSAKDPKKQLFSFDQVHGPQTEQHSMFSTTALPLVSKFIQGFNCTILAYGQTSSGKTYTMTGIDLDADPSDPSNGLGIVPRAVAAIFTSANKLKQERAGTWNYSIKGSFIEIYNEDLLDLLDDPNQRREVQIREDKDGHIIWGGLREVSVNNTSEVMSLIRKGTSIRRTNETDMNAQSSRSHAIFSLTLTQKKHTGGTPPAAAAPGRNTSRLARPGSAYVSSTSSRVGSPTFGRPSTPSFSAAMNRGGLRPSSALGHAGDKSFHSVPDEDPGEWVTVVSKFHFVDLAGSERLKRTAAAGERIKEGISINSGLLALGNVISALGDPARAKSNTASHVPYRDSKLTRLLQDSLGGNAHTLMIACVSPAEYNAAETVNTLKYANRARNIKNRATINEKENGWDDIEWLQGTVTRLRKDVKSLKEGGAIPSSGAGDPVEGAGKKVLAQMTELQNNYEDLREKFVVRTEELTRLRRELGEKTRMSGGGSIGGSAKYEEIVGPVIEEYEKTIDAMEAELSLNRAALRHTNEMVEEKEEELAQITERHSATELYVEELKARVCKLGEREASTEAYIRDLEDRVKVYDDSNTSSSESIGDLKREISKFKGSELSSAKYISDLEARLAKADESVLTLQQTVEKLEQESYRRRDEAEVLRARLQDLQNDSHGWRSDLETRERKMKELQEKMEEWESRKQEAGEERERMGDVVEKVANARRSLEIDLASPIDHDASSLPTPRTLSPQMNGVALPAVEVNGTSNVDSQFKELQQTHTATLADLSNITSKYRDSLREIADLAAQIQEAKFGATTNATSSSTDSPTADRDKTLDLSGAAPSTRTNLRGGVGYNTPGSGSRRVTFFRQAASMESLHSRSLSQSLSLSQELSSVHSRKTSFGSSGSAPGASPAVGGHGHTHSHSHSHSNSGSSTSTGVPSARPNLSISLPPPSTTPNGSVDQTRTVQSLEKEIMRLQEVLREREKEISFLEGREIDEVLPTAPMPPPPSSNNYPTPSESDILETSDESSDGSDVSPRKVKVNGHKPAMVNGSISVLSPETVRQFDRIRDGMSHGGDAVNGDRQENTSAVSESDGNMEKLNELMLSMAQKESQHREVVDDITSQLAFVKKQFDDLTALSKNQALNMSTEMASLHTRHDEQCAELQKLQDREQELGDLLQKEKTLASQLRSDRDEALTAKGTEVDELLQRMKTEHETSIQAVQKDLTEASDKLKDAIKDHESAITSLRAEFEQESQKRSEVEQALVEAKDGHERALTKAIAEHEELRKQEKADASASQHRIEEEYYNALTKIRGDHALSFEQTNKDHDTALERLREEHTSAMRLGEIARQGSLSESESASSAAIIQLRDEHASALSKKEESLAEQIEMLKSEHSRALSTREEDHSIGLEKLRAESEHGVLRLTEENRVEVEKLRSENMAAKEEFQDTIAKMRKESDAVLRSVKEDHEVLLAEIERSHVAERERLVAEHATALKSSVDVARAEALAKAEKKREELLQSHVVYVTDLKAQHQQSITEVNNSVVAMQEQHQSVLEATHAEAEATLAQEKAQLEETLEDLREQQEKERDLLVKNRDLLGNDLAVLKDEANVSREKEVKVQKEVKQKLAVIKDIETQLASAKSQVSQVQAKNSALEAELNKTRTETKSLIQAASKRESLVLELEHHRSILAELQENLQKVKDEKDTLQTEKIKTESQLRELKDQLSRGPSSPTLRGAARPSGLPPKLPPPTPPPAGPPPPAPKIGHVNADSIPSASSHATSSIITTSSSRESAPDSPATSVGPVSSIGQLDSKITIRLEAQAKLLEEQEVMIKTLNKQLTHCETDLQTHMDLVSTLEGSLGDSEKNLRKARMHATELARERDSLNAKILALQNELGESRKEVANVRRSVVEEKQSLEQRLDEERKAKERARQQLDSRMDELQRRKSKFACL